MAIRSAPQLEDRLADAQRRAHLDRTRAGQLVAADVRAVGRAEVLDEPAVAGRVGIDAAVPAGRIVVVEDERALRVAPDEDAAAAKGQRRAGERPLRDDEGGRDALAAPGPTRRGTGRATSATSGTSRSGGPSRTRCGAAHGRGLAPGAGSLLLLRLLLGLGGLALGPAAHRRAVDVGAKHADDAEDEDPQQREQTQPQQGQGEFTHASPCVVGVVTWVIAARPGRLRWCARG